MKLIINTSVLRFGGAVQGAASFINACRHFPENEYYIFAGLGIKKVLDVNEFPDNFYFYDLDSGPISLIKIPILARRLTSLEREILPDCIFTPSGPSYWHSIAPQIIGYNLGLYLYTESPFFKLISPYRKLRWYIKRKLHLYFFKRDSAGYVVQTGDVNQRLRKIIKSENVYTISNTYNNYYIQPKIFSNKLPVREDGEIRLLTITAYYRHKNLEIIPLVQKLLEQKGYKNIKFVLTLDETSFTRIFPLSGNIINVGPVHPEECPSLYSECDIMFLPTLAECFSASYPEAMIMQKPIVTTDLSFARDICRDAALYYKPLNAESAADAIIQMVLNAELKEMLINKGIERVKDFNNPNERASKILSVCCKIADEERKRQ